MYIPLLVEEGQQTGGQNYVLHPLHYFSQVVTSYRGDGTTFNIVVREKLQCWTNNYGKKTHIREASTWT